MSQNYKNHRQVPVLYFLVIFFCIVLLVDSIYNIMHAQDGQLPISQLICFIAFILPLILVISRMNALKNQDRAIRAEEKLRYYILTGKPLPSSITLPQIIALRFASDEELPALVEQAAKENLSNKEIKLRIKNWKADYNRV